MASICFGEFRNLISCWQGRILKFETGIRHFLHFERRICSSNLSPAFKIFGQKVTKKQKVCFIPIAIHCCFVDMDDQAWSSSAWPSFDFGVCGTDHREFGLGVV
jgi:hypothetical protein